VRGYYDAAQERLKAHYDTWLWHTALPFAFRHPIESFRRYRLVLRGIRWMKFSTPLFMLLDKLRHRTRDLWRTWTQATQAGAARRERIRRRSLLNKDIEKIDAALQIQAMARSRRAKAYKQALYQQQEKGEYQTVAWLQRRMNESVRRNEAEVLGLREQLTLLKEASRRRSMDSSIVYDSLMKLKQELSTMKTHILSSNLIPPNSHFGVSWRMIVAACVLLEIFRLIVSWRVTGGASVNVPLGVIMSDAFVPIPSFCNNNEHRTWRSRMADHLLIFLPEGERSSHVSTMDLNLCLRATSRSTMIRRVGGAINRLIGAICSLDILVWFFTGELDEKGIIVPKPFFARCIVPGTLTQVLDHPTLPAEIALVVGNILREADAVGYARAVRWALALSPLVTLLSEPTLTYLFHPRAPTETCQVDRRNFAKSFVY